MATRKLKLQVQMTVDGFVAGPEGQLDWMTQHDEGVIARIVQITDSSDTILLGRKMTGSKSYPSGIVVNTYEPAATK